MQQDIAEIDGIQRAQTRLIGGIKFNPAVIKRTAICGGHIIRRQRAVFPAINDPCQHARRPALFVNVSGTDQLLHQTDLVVGIQNRKARLEPNQFSMAAQQLGTDRMERPQPRHALNRLPHHRANTVFHFARGFVGKCHCQNLMGLRIASKQQMTNAGRQRLGLTCASTRQHQHRSVYRFNRLALRRVQPIQIGGCTAGHGTLGQRNCGLKGIIFGIIIHVGHHNHIRRCVKALFTLCSARFFRA